MKKKDITKPVMLYAAEEIYLKISEIKLTQITIDKYKMLRGVLLPGALKH